MIMPPDLVIFDCDGVLVDSEPITNEVMRASFADHGLEMSLDEIMALFVGGTMQGVFERGRVMGAALEDNWIDEIYQQMFEALEQQCELITGVERVLDALDAAGIPFAIGSNGPHAKMAVTLNKTGLMDRVEGRIVSREDVARPKPAPDVYLLAAKRAGVLPDRCAVVEDSASGAKAGRAAGMFAFGYAADTPRQYLEPICDVLFDDMEDLVALLGLTEP